MMPDPSMTSAPSPGAAPDAGADAGTPADASQGYTITITVAADQSIKVGVEPGIGDDSDDGSAAAAGDGSSDDESQSVPNIKAACKVVMDIFNNAGQIQDAAQDQDQMSSGYGKAGM